MKHIINKPLVLYIFNVVCVYVVSALSADVLIIIFKTKFYVRPAWKVVNVVYPELFRWLDNVQ